MRSLARRACPTTSACPRVASSVPRLQGQRASRLTRYPGGVTDGDEDRSGIRARGEEALGELAQALLENPLFNNALATALGAGERAVAAQRQAVGALNIAAQSDLERVEQRLRSLSNRLEAIEDGLDAMGDELASMRRQLADRAPEAG